MKDFRPRRRKNNWLYPLIGALLLFSIMLLVVDVGDDDAVEEVKEELEEVLDSTDTVVEEVVESEAPVVMNIEKVEPKSVETPEELLSELESRQHDVLMERSGVVKEKREVLDIINSDIPFEDKQFYQKAYDVLKAKQSELTLEATLLESKISSLKKQVEGKELIGAYENAIESLEENKQEYEDKLRDVAKKILDVRTKMLDAIDSVSLRDELDELEAEEDSLLAKYDDVLEDLDGYKEKLDEIVTGEFSKDYSDLLLERQAYSQELDVVRNSIVEFWIKLESAASDVAGGISNTLNDLEDYEDELESRIYEVDRRIENVTG